MRGIPRRVVIRHPYTHRIIVDVIYGALHEVWPHVQLANTFLPLEYMISYNTVRYWTSRPLRRYKSLMWMGRITQKPCFLDEEIIEVGHCDDFVRGEPNKCDAFAKVIDDEVMVATRQLMILSTAK